MSPREVRASRLLSLVAAGPLIVRSVVFGAGYAALSLAVPPWVTGPPVMVGMLALALLTAVLPASPWPSILEYLAVIAWFLATTAYRYETGLGHLFGLAVAVYLHHSACALAAVVPAAAVVEPRLLLSWTLRTLAIVALTLPLGLLVLALPEWLGRSRQVAVPVLGLAALVIGSLVLVRLSRRPG